MTLIDVERLVLYDRGVLKIRELSSQMAKSFNLGFFAGLLAKQAGLERALPHGQATTKHLRLFNVVCRSFAALRSTDMFGYNG